ncbi:hypothetical protein ACJX0J_025061, partial [Zea mays]
VEDLYNNVPQSTCFLMSWSYYMLPPKFKRITSLITHHLVAFFYGLKEIHLYSYKEMRNKKKNKKTCCILWKRVQPCSIHLFLCIWHISLQSNLFLGFLPIVRKRSKIIKYLSEINHYRLCDQEPLP